MQDSFAIVCMDNIFNMMQDDFRLYIKKQNLLLLL